MNLLRLLQSLLQLALSPTRGWEDIALDDQEFPEKSVAISFYLLMVIVSLTWIVQKLYHPGLDTLKIIELVIVTFASFFVCYFVGTFIMSVSLESLIDGGEVNERHTRHFVICGLSLLSIILLISNVLPTGTPVLWFLPVYVLVILWKGAKFLNVRRKRGAVFTIISFIAVILPIGLLSWIFKILLL